MNGPPLRFRRGASRPSHEGSGPNDDGRPGDGVATPGAPSGDEAPGGPPDDVASVRFEEFEIRVDALELRRGDRPVHLPPQAVRLLLHLTLREGEVVGRDELRRLLWGDAFVDFEQGLNNSIHRIRAALGDDAQAPRYVETLPRRGYRWLIPVERVAAPPRVAPRRRRTAALIALGLTAVAVASILARAATTRHGDGADLRIAVPEFEVAGDSPELRVAGEELTESTTAELARRLPRGVRVLGRVSLEAGASDREAYVGRAARLGASHLLAGSLLEGESVSIQLLRLPAGETVWARLYDLGAASLDGLESRIVSDLGGALGIALRSVSRDPELPEALADQRLRARWYLRSGRFPEAAHLYHLLVREVPEHAGLRAEFASALFEASRHESDPEIRDSTVPVIRYELDEALRLDPGHPTALLRRAQLALFADRDWSAAEHWAKRAVTAAPSWLEARLFYSRYLSSAGRHEEAIEHILEAKRLDPESAVVYGNLGITFFWARRYEEAVDACRLALELNPRSGEDGACYIQSMIRLGRIEEARRFALVRMRDRGFSGADVERVATCPPAEVEPTYLRILMNDLISSGAPLRLDFKVYFHALLGERDLAVAALREAVESESWYLPWIASDPDIDSMRADPEFAALLARTRQPRVWPDPSRDRRRAGDASGADDPSTG